MGLVLVRGGGALGYDVSACLFFSATCFFLVIVPGVGLFVFLSIWFWDWLNYSVDLEFNECEMGFDELSLCKVHGILRVVLA